MNEIDKFDIIWGRPRVAEFQQRIIIPPLTGFDKFKYETCNKLMWNSIVILGLFLTILLVLSVELLLIARTIYENMQTLAAIFTLGLGAGLLLIILKFKDQLR